LYLFLATKRQNLALEIAEVKPEEPEDPIITLMKNLELTGKQKRAVAKYLGFCGGDCEGCNRA